MLIKKQQKKYLELKKYNEGVLLRARHLIRLHSREMEKQRESEWLLRREIDKLKIYKQLVEKIEIGISETIKSS